MAPLFNTFLPCVSINVDCHGPLPISFRRSPIFPPSHLLQQNTGTKTNLDHFYALSLSFPPVVPIFQPNAAPLSCLTFHVLPCPMMRVMLAQITLRSSRTRPRISVPPPHQATLTHPASPILRMNRSPKTSWHWKMRRSNFHQNTISRRPSASMSLYFGRNATARGPRTSWMRRGNTGTGEAPFG